jgi:uncharacterized protein
MEWRGQRESDNVEDVRGSGVGRTAVVGGGIGTVVLALIYMALGGDPRVVLDAAQQVAPVDRSRPSQVADTPASAEQKQFVAVVLGETEDVWRVAFEERGGHYLDPKLVLFTGAVDSACGTAESAMGPFYCPGDQRVFLDLSFFDELSGRFGAPGEFARAYVIAHEVGHHVQKLLGISTRVHALQRQADQAGANALSVRLELQADCYAGIWANRSERALKLTPEDIRAALGAASAVGDDRLQKAARGYVTPESFTHGSSAQRMHWFQQGFTTGRLEACDTFAG